MALIFEKSRWVSIEARALDVVINDHRLAAWLLDPVV